MAALGHGVLPPAARGAAGRQRARAPLASAHRSEHEPACDGHGRPAADCRTVAELALDIVSPAVRSAAGREPARMRPACAHGREGKPARHGYRRCATGDTAAVVVANLTLRGCGPA